MNRNKTIIIAEAGVNHNGSVELAKQLIDVAADAEVDYVKFQTFKADKLVSKNAVKAEYQAKNMEGDEDSSQYNMLKKLELDLATHHVLIDYCKEKGVKFLSTPFDTESIDQLDELGVDIFKVPSGDLTNLPYLKKLAQKNKPVILSTGMSYLSEIEKSILALQEAGLDKSMLTVLHCNTEYPTPMQDVNLKAMHTIGQAFGVKIGYSDHTLGIEVPIAAVTMGATVIEKHFTLDKNMEGPDHKASLEPHELKAMVQAIRNIELALGDGIKQPSDSEKKNIEIARKSLHLATEVKAGHVLREEDLAIKRPATGISPMDIEKVIGMSVKQDMEADAVLNWKDIN